MNESDEPIYLLKKGKKGLLQLVFSRVGIVIVFLLLQILMLLAFFQYVSTNYVHVFYGGAIVVTIFGYMFLLNSSSDGSVKLTWMILFTVLPIIGIFFYFYMRLELGHRLEKRRLIRLKNESNNLIQTSSTVKEKIKTEKDLLGVATFLSGTGSYPVYENSELVYFPTGEDKFYDLLEELKKS
jgi:cardiolipin synthase